MLKTLGALLIISVCGVFGVRASAFLKHRKQKLEAFCFFIGEIEDKMRHGVELESIYKTKAAKRLLEVSGYRVTVLEDGLSAEDKKLLSDFFSKLGMGDLQSGIALCESYRQLFGKRAEIASKAAEEKSRLYSVIGLCSGVFIVILLI